MNMASYKNGMNTFIWSFLTVLLCIDGQPDYLRPEIDLCEKLQGYEPNGAHLPSPGDKIMAYVNWTGPNKPQMCLMRFSTCESCRLRVTPLSAFEFYPCIPSENYLHFDGWCAPGCTYLHLYDRDYIRETAKSYSNETLFEDYVTQSRFLYVIACANKSLENRIFMKINISSEEKTTIFQATSTDVGKELIFASPFFPDEYTLNSEVYKYIFLCASQDMFITISFDDWQLADTSSLTFNNANVAGPVKGSNSRPWIISNSFRLVMTFNTGSYFYGDHIGFKATYTFQNEKDRSDMPAIVTNCGDWITQRESGIISFNPTFNGRDYYDCLWVIEKHDSFDGVLVKVINYSISGTDVYSSRNQINLLQIRSGLTSTGQIKETALPSTNPRDAPVFDTLTSSDGFYVRLKGHYSGSRDFVLAFASYKTDNCRNLFLCDNGRCIPSYLKCDGIDHCGDYSDESYLLCGPTTSSGGSGIQYGSTLSVGIIIPIVVSVFLLVVICLLVIFIRRCRKLSIEAHRSRQFGQHVSTISGTVSSRQRHNRRRGHGPGPTFEPPPAYEEALHTTPIGYLNMAFSDRQSNPLTGLLEPPSYEEAMTPTESCPPSSSHDLSSNSSSPETVALSHFSSSYSSDDMHPGDDHCHEYQGQLHNNNSVSSSDGSSEDMDHANAWHNVRLGHGHGVAVRPKGNVEQPNSRQSIAKPVDENVCSVEVPLNECPSNKQLNHKHNKKGSQQANEEDLNQITPSIMNSARDLENARRFSQAAVTEDPSLGTFCHVENSPVICAPPVVPSNTPRLPQTVDGSCRGDGDVPKMGISFAQYGTGTDMLSSRPTPQKRYARNPNASDSKQPRQDAESRKVHDGGKKRHLGKNGHTPYSLLSRSMVDISRQGEQVSVKPLQTTKMLSKSVDNILHDSLDRQSVQTRNGLQYGGVADDSVLSPGHWNEAAALPERYLPFERDASRDHAQGGKDGAKPTPRPRKSLLRKNKSGQTLDPHERLMIDESQQHQRKETQGPDSSTRGVQNQRSKSSMSSEGRTIPDPENRRFIHDVGKDGQGNSRSERPSPGHEGALPSGVRERQDGSQPRFSPPVNSFKREGQETGRGGIDKWPELTQSTGNTSDQNSKKLPGQMNNHSHDTLPRNMQPNAYHYERECSGQPPRDAEPRNESSGGRSRSSRNPAGQNSVPAFDRPLRQGDNRSLWPDLPQHARLTSGQNGPQQPRDAAGEFNHHRDRPPQQDGRSTWIDAPQQHRIQSHDGRSRPPREAAAGDQFRNNSGRPPRQGGDGPPRSEGFHYPRGQSHEKAPHSSRNIEAASENSMHRVQHAAPSVWRQPDNRSTVRGLQEAGDGISQGIHFSGHNRPIDSRLVQPNSSRDGHASSTAKDRYSKPGMVRDTSTGSPKDYADPDSRKGAVSNIEGQAGPSQPDNAPVCLQLENSKPEDVFV